MDWLVAWYEEWQEEVNSDFADSISDGVCDGEGRPCIWRLPAWFEADGGFFPSDTCAEISANDCKVGFTSFLALHLERPTTGRLSFLFFILRASPVENCINVSRPDFRWVESSV